ncbi:hypothetical protein ABPG74_006338 [Tetrahymena malaccensis]
MIQLKDQKQYFLKCIQERIWTFKVFKGEGDGEVVFSFDISHIQLDQNDQHQQEQANLEKKIKTMFVMYHTRQAKDCFFFSLVDYDQYDILYQHYLYDKKIFLPNLHQNPQNIERLLERDSQNQENQQLFLLGRQKIQFLDLLEISLVQEVELIGNRQYKNVIIYISRQKFKEILKDESALDLKIQKVVQKAQGVWKEQSNQDLFPIIKNILDVINKEYRVANHNYFIDNRIRQDQLYLFWPVLDETDYSNPYIDTRQLQSRNKVIDLKPGHHIFIWPGTLSLFCNNQKHAIYEGSNKVAVFNLQNDEFYSIETFTLQKFKQDEQFISLCEYGIKEEDAFFRRAYTYSNHKSDHPFKVLIRSQLFQSLREPIQVPKEKLEVDYLPKICKTSFYFDTKIKKLHSLVDKVVSAFNDTFFVSLGN